MTPDPLDLLTTAEVAAMIRKPVGTLRYWRSKDLGPKSGRLGSTVLYKRADVDSWLREQLEQTARGGAVAS